MKRQIIVYLFVLVSLRNEVFAEQSKLSSPLSSEILKKFLFLWQESAYGQDPNRVETAVWIVLNTDNKYEFIKWPHSGERNKEFWKGAIPKNVVAQVHTHTVIADPKPSRLDRSCAQRIKAPVYTISGVGIWKVTSAGEITKEIGRDWWIELDDQTLQN